MRNEGRSSQLSTAWTMWIKCNASEDQPRSHVRLAFVHRDQTDVRSGDACGMSVAKQAKFAWRSAPLL